MLDQLPDEIVMYIFERCPGDIDMLRQVSRRMRHIANIIKSRYTRTVLGVFDLADRWLRAYPGRLAIAASPCLWLYMGMPTAWAPSTIIIYDLAAGAEPIKHIDTHELLPTFDQIPPDAARPNADWRYIQVDRCQLTAPPTTWTITIKIARGRFPTNTLEQLLTSFNISFYCFGYTIPRDVKYIPFRRFNDTDDTNGTVSVFDPKHCFVNPDHELVDDFSDNLRYHGFGIHLPNDVYLHPL